MDYRSKFAAILAPALESLGIPPDVAALEAEIDVPKDRALGHFAYPCFRAAKTARKSPQAVATAVAEAVAGAASADFTSVRATGPYVNAFVRTGPLAEYLARAVDDCSFLAPRLPTDRKVMVEYSQPNTHKAFHVGHIRAASLGDSLARILAWRGDTVIPVNYIGDEGTHVAKCLWYLGRHFTGSVPSEDRGEFLGILYMKAHDMLDVSLYTRAPVPGVVAARVAGAAPHPEEPEWTVLSVDAGGEGPVRVVAAATGLAPGDVVPYAPPGLRMGPRLIGVADRKGVSSHGMVCSEKEIGLSDDPRAVPRLPPDTVPGSAVAEAYRIPSALDDPRPVLSVMKERQEEVSDVLRKLEGGDPLVAELWSETKAWSMEDYHRVYEWLDCRFDHYFFESEFGESGKEMVRAGLEAGVLVESEGAVGADLSEEGLGFCILLKRDGTANYATRDLALARKKFQEFGVETSVYVVDASQSLHFRQVFSVLDKLGFREAGRCVHVPYGLVVRPDGKMSSRKGNVILFTELRSRLLEKVDAEFLGKYRGEWTEDEVRSAAHAVALATMRYGMLNQDNQSQVVFDLDDWTSRSGNTGPYLLYAYARMSSIVREAASRQSEERPADPEWSALGADAETDLLLHLLSYPEHVHRAAAAYSPHVVCAYVYELSKRFSTFYHDCPVLRAETPGLRAARLGLVSAAAAVLAHGLSLLGIRTVPRM